MKQLIVIAGVVSVIFSTFAQEHPTDSLDTTTLKEIVVIAHPTNKHHNECKALGSLDNYLESSPSVNMIKRGAYAWEPMLQGLSSERSVLTIDGMRIYGACTDKMDPVTSYVEISNLSKALISDGQSGAEHGGTIAGSIDLVRRKSGFGNQGWGGSFFTGGESVNYQKIIGSTVQYSGEHVFADLDVTYRDAENYFAGGRKEVLYSQFTKYNISAITGIKINENQHLEASLIFDEATDVGYPALPMDVSLAQAFIASLQYEVHPLSELISRWETKVYFNTITHLMDDSPRPDVPIRMDMPGWSKTWGIYSKFSGKKNKHSWKTTLSGHYNNSLAEMTMYPNNPGESEMYMITWPDVNTLYGGLHLEDNISLKSHFSLLISGGIGLQYNEIDDLFGLQSLQIFYPGLHAEKSRILKNLATRITYQNLPWQFHLAVGYGERAPSVTEGYGFYLFNSYDGYDYVGNPSLKNEKSLDVSVSAQFKTKNIALKWQAAYFHINDYIIGKPDERLLPMTIGANGIKVYEQLDYASLFTTHFTAETRFLNNFSLTGNLSYKRGQDFNENNLPLIQPLTYEGSLRFRKNLFFAETTIAGATAHKNFSAEFGESQKDPYTIAHITLSQIFYFDQQKLVLKAGAENIFDKYYTTFADWNNIPRPGRNFFINVLYVL